jgi:cell fate regulator YaaT (PSP1 superfamily)
MHLIEVAFKGNRKDFFLWDADDPPPLKVGVIVDADRGEDLGFVHSTGWLADRRNLGTPHGYGTAGATKKVRRLATPDEVQRVADLRNQDEDARRRAMERVKANQLVMKLSDAEWQWDRKKLTLYFTAEKRVDFRTLVRELASMFRTRIELKQIGVRDEAKRLDGIGRCGRQYCSSSWLPELRPVNLGVAKDQRLSLNPSQISGACGRLMCCLRYEHDFYVQSRKRFPKEGRPIRTKRGEEKVIANDIFRERVTLRGDDGEQRTITLDELRAETTAIGVPLPVAASAPRVSEPVMLEGDDALVEDGDPIEPVVVIEAGPGETPIVGEPAAERKAHRRRGRRGGRRNRHGKSSESPGSDDDSDDGGAPPSASDGP